MLWLVIEYSFIYLFFCSFPSVLVVFLRIMNFMSVKKLKQALLIRYAFSLLKSRKQSSPPPNSIFYLIASLSMFLFYFVHVCTRIFRQAIYDSHAVLEDLSVTPLPRESFNALLTGLGFRGHFDMVT